MTVAEYQAAFTQRALACGFTRDPGPWHRFRTPAGGVLLLEFPGVPIDRDTWCYEARWRVTGAEQADYQHLAALDAAVRDLPARFDYRTNGVVPAHVPARGGFGSGAENDTRGT